MVRIVAIVDLSRHAALRCTTLPSCGHLHIDLAHHLLAHCVDHLVDATLGCKHLLLRHHRRGPQDIHILGLVDVLKHIHGNFFTSTHAHQPVADLIWVEALRLECLKEPGLLIHEVARDSGTCSCSLLSTELSSLFARVGCNVVPAHVVH